MKRKYLAFPYLLWIILFTVIPLGMVLYYGFVNETPAGIVFSISNFAKALEPVYLIAFWRSMYYAGISTIVCLIIAYPLALILTQKHNAGNTIIFIFILPMWMNFLLRTYAWLTLLETNNGFINTVLRALSLPTIDIMNKPAAIILGMVYNFLPFMVLPIYNTLSKIDPSILEAAHDLGANNFKRLLRVILPLSIPGILSGISMVFMPAVTTFVIPNLLGGGKISLIGNVIEQQFLQTYNWYFGASLSIILMVVILLTMAVLNRFEESEKQVGIW